MQKAAKLFSKLLIERQALFEQKFGIELTGKILENQRGEDSYDISYAGGEIEFAASRPSIGIYVLSRLLEALKSQSLKNILGNKKLRLKKRILWLVANVEVPLSENCRIYLPRLFLHSDSLERACQRILEMGYNTILLSKGNLSVQKQTLDLLEIQKIFEVLKQFDLHVLIRPVIQDDHDLENVQRSILALQELTDSDIYWDAMYRFFQEDSVYLNKNNFIDTLLSQLQTLSILLKPSQRLYFHLPWDAFICPKIRDLSLKELYLNLPANTRLVFPYVAGRPTQDYLTYHPFFEEFDAKKPWMPAHSVPVLNAGAAELGEGFWPSIHFEWMSHLRDQIQDGLEEVIVLTHSLPTSKSLLDCNLNLIVDAAISHYSAEAFVKNWFKAKEGRFVEEQLSWLKKMREFIKKLGWIKSLTQESQRDELSSEEGKIVSEDMVAQFKEFNRVFEHLFKSEHQSLLTDLYTLFQADVKRILIHFFQCYNLSHPTLLDDTQLDASFWTDSLENNKGENLRSACKIIFYDEPQLGSEKGKRNQLYQQLVVS